MHTEDGKGEEEEVCELLDNKKTSPSVEKNEDDYSKIYSHNAQRTKTLTNSQFVDGRQQQIIA